MIAPAGAASEAFWNGCASGRLMLPRCAHCALARSPLRPRCPGCSSVAHGWVEAGGRGTLYAITTLSRAPDDTFVALLPYAIALVDLDEGVRLMAHATPGLSIGERVKATFLAHDGRHLPRFVRDDWTGAPPRA